MANEKEIDALLLIADISGYTKFMISNKQSIKHSQMIITELTKTIIKQIEIPFQISKLEGDAVFLYAVKAEDTASWQTTSAIIDERIKLFFQAFSDKVREITESNMCGCTACTNVAGLKLKLIIHSGRVLCYTIDKFEELSGVDVIILHRLLKNSVDSHEYVLVTEQAFVDIQFAQHLKFERGKESYDDIGDIKTFVFYPNQIPVIEPAKYNTRLYKLKYELKKIFFRGQSR
jgi:hypothetical protein